MKFTPGPWEVYDRSIVQTPWPTEQIAACYGANGPANARLIAVAPEMYEALDAISRCPGEKRDALGVYIRLSESDVANIAAVLAKVRGSK